MKMCKICGTECKELESQYPCGPCPNLWKCPDCGETVSPCCGAKIEYEDCEGCDTCRYCGPEICSECDTHCHCGGCI